MFSFVFSEGINSKRTGSDSCIEEKKKAKKTMSSEVQNLAQGKPITHFQVHVLPGVPGIVTFIDKNIQPLIFLASLALSIQLSC